MGTTNYAVSLIGDTSALVSPTVGGKTNNGFTASFGSNYSGALDWIAVSYTQ